MGIVLRLETSICLGIRKMCTIAAACLFSFLLLALDARVKDKFLEHCANADILIYLVLHRTRRLRTKPRILDASTASLHYLLRLVLHRAIRPVARFLVFRALGTGWIVGIFGISLLAEVAAVAGGAPPARCAGSSVPGVAEIHWGSSGRFLVRLGGSGIGG
jgi:hypothetical protein